MISMLLIKHSSLLFHRQRQIIKVLYPCHQTAAIGAAAPTIDVAYDVPKLYKYLDYVHIMCYDYHGKWDRKTGHNAPLYSRLED